MRSISITLIGIVICCTSVFGQNEKDLPLNTLNFFSGTFGEANGLALKEDKSYFVVVYTDAEQSLYKFYNTQVFTDSSVVASFSKHFVCLSASLESDRGKNLAKQFQVTKFPAMFFVSQEGELLYTIPGKMEPDQLLDQIERSVFNN